MEQIKGARLLTGEPNIRIEAQLAEARQYLEAHPDDGLVIVMRFWPALLGGIWTLASVIFSSLWLVFYLISYLRWS